MAYGAGQENYIGEEGKQTPTEKYKLILMDTLKKCIELDVNLKDEEFIRSVEQLHNLMRLYAIHRTEIVGKYEAEMKDTESELDKIDKDAKSGYNQEQKNGMKLKVKYDSAKRRLALIIDMMNNSPIIEKEMEGLFYSPTSIKDYKKIRERIQAVRVE